MELGPHNVAASCLGSQACSGELDLDRVSTFGHPQTWRRMALKASSCQHSLRTPQQRLARQDLSCSTLPKIVSAPLPEPQSAPAGAKPIQSAASRWVQHTFELEGRLQPLLVPRRQTLRNGRKFDLGRCRNQVSWGCALSGWPWPGQPAAAEHQTPCPGPASWRSTCCPQRPQLQLSAGRRDVSAELAAEMLDETCMAGPHLFSAATA